MAPYKLPDNWYEMDEAKRYRYLYHYVEYGDSPFEYNKVKPDQIRRMVEVAMVQPELWVQWVNGLFDKYIQSLGVPVASVKYMPHYELTLTVPAGLNIQESIKDLNKAIADVAKSKMLNVRDAYYVYELHEDGRPHVHMLLKPKDNATIQASRIKRFFPHRFTLSKVRDLHAYCEYLIKNFDDSQHIEFKNTHNLQDQPPPNNYASSQTLSP